MTRGGIELVTTRSFAWGVLIIGDADTRAIPSSLDGGVAVTDSTLAISVRHAHDVDESTDAEFMVEVRCAAGTGDSQGINASLAIPSGRLAVGDANHDDVIHLDPGRWRVHVETEPTNMPERVAIWPTCDSA